MRREQQEIMNFLQEVDVKGIKSVIFPESFFFSENNPNNFHILNDQSEIFRDFHIFIDIVKNLILRNVKIHIQTSPQIQEKLDRFSIFEMICDMTAINRHKLLEHLMFYYDMTVPQISSRLIKNVKPSFGINIVNKGIQKARNILSFSMNYKNSTNNHLRSDEIAIVLDPGFSTLQREELLLGNFRVIELAVFYRKPKKIVKNNESKVVQANKERVSNSFQDQLQNRQTPVEEILRRIPNPTMQSRNATIGVNSKYMIAQNIYDESLKIYNELKHRSQEFSRSAVELKMKSDRQKEILKNIDSMISKNLSGISRSDLNDAKLQCYNDIQTYDQQCKDFFDLYVQISEQASEAKEELIRAQKELKKYS